MIKDLCSHNLAELQQLLEGWGEPPYRAKQLFKWAARAVSPEDMSNIPKPLRERLLAMYRPVKVHTKLQSAQDGTVKYLFSLFDGNLVEGVLMRYEHGNTLCISTQVGCRMGCAFCASTLGGCVRDLSAGEMLGFVACVEQGEGGDRAKRAITNIVLMGSGEPLDNYENVVRFLQLVTDASGFNISVRNISLSTCGLLSALERFTMEAPHVTLSISLHAANDRVRSELMPVNKSYGVAAVVAAAKSYAEKTGRRVIFEYALIRGVNDSEQAAYELAARLKGVNCHVNLIPLNPVKERGLNGSSRSEAYRFMRWLTERGVSTTVRRQLGADINGACGQLRRSVEQR